MKYLVYVFIFIFSLVGCSSDKERRLNNIVAQAESIMDMNSMSAYKLLSNNESLAHEVGTDARMRFYLSKSIAQNKAYIAFSSDSLSKEIVSYFNDHGSDYDRMMAYYILGCAYRDMNDGAQALEKYSKAIAFADNNSSADLRSLVVIHAQVANIFEEQGIVDNAIEEEKAAALCAWKVKDTLTALNCLGHVASNYLIRNNVDSCIKIKDYILKHCYLLKDTIHAAIACGTYGTALLQKGDYVKAKQYFDFYEKYSGYFDSLGNVVKGKEIHYYDKGMYYLGVNKLDSAEYFFRKEKSEASDLFNQNGAIHGLSLVYERKNIPDSTAKYALACYKLNDSLFNSENSKKYQQLQALLNYNRHLQKSIEKTEETNKIQQRLYTLIIITIVLLWIVTYWFKHRLRLQRKETLRLKDAYLSTIKQYSQEKEELKLLMQQNVTDNHTQIARKEKMILELENRINKYKKEKTLQEISAITIEIQNSSIFKHFIYICEKINTMPSNTDWEDLCQMINETMPTFKTQILKQYPVSEKEYKICMLSKLGFKPYQMANLMGLSCSDISQTRRRLFVKIFHIKGSASDFDNSIRAL